MEMEKELLATVNDYQDLIEKEDAVLIYFYNDNCAPCLSLRPKVIDLIDGQFPKIDQEV